MQQSASDQESPLLAGAAKDTDVYPPQLTDEERRYRDKAFLLLFLFNLVAVVYVASTFGYGALSYDGNESQTGRRSTGLLVGCLCGLGVGGSIASGMWATFMMKKANKLIMCTLWATVVFNLLGVVLGIAIQEFILVASSAIMAVLGFCYLRAAKPYVPFASAQLTVGVAALRESLTGVMLVAYSALVLSLVWAAVSSLAVYGLVDYYHREEDQDGSSASASSSAIPPVGVRGLIYFLLVVSFLWTQKVLAGVVTVTVAGVVGSWWFTPPPPPQHQQVAPGAGVVRGALGRAATTSLGSICLGSLVVSVIEAVRALVEQARQRRQQQQQQGDGGSPGGGGQCLLCLCDCVLSMLDSLAQVWSRWAFCYVGLYGTSFRESGMRVMHLFKRRGLTAVLDDNLISRVLMLGSVLVGLLTCGLGLVLAALPLWPSSSSSEEQEEIKVILAVGGLMVGFVVSDVMMGQISSAVSTIYVCFAEDAAALQNNHPDYYEYMRVAWQARFPTVVF